MPAISLSLLARKACIRNIRSIHDVGDAPYEVVRPLLLRVDNAEQLHEIEKNSPQVCGPDAEVWKLLIRRDIPRWDEEKDVPKSYSKWHMLYQRLLEDNRRELEDTEKILKDRLAGIKSAQAQNTARKVELNIVKPPKGVDRSGAEVIRLPRNSAFFRGGIGGSGLSRLSSSDITKATPLVRRSKVAQIRKEAMAMSRFPRKDPPGSFAPQKPKHPTVPVVSAPSSMLQTYKSPISPRPLDLSSTTRPPGKRQFDATSSADTTHTHPDELHQRQSRLRATKVNKTKSDTGHSLSDASTSAAQPSTSMRIVRVPRKPSMSRTADRSAKGDQSPPIDAHASNQKRGNDERNSGEQKPEPRLNDKLKGSDTVENKGKSPQKRIVRIKKKAPANPLMPMKRQRVC